MTKALKLPPLFLRDLKSGTFREQCTRWDSNPEPSDPLLARKSELLVP